MTRILIVDDEEILRDLAADTLELSGYECFKAKDAMQGLELLASEEPDLILSDFKMPGMNGLEFLKEVQHRRPGTPFIIVTAFGTVETAVEAMRNGANHFIEKPYEPEKLELIVGAVLETANLRRENKELRQELAKSHAFVGGGSPAFQELQQLVRDVADSGATILITGESGVGKEVLARSIHTQSRRAGGPFVKVNCAALPESLIESELFGHEKGAFTGALRTKKGKFELAHLGTLLLDEIGEMPLSAQAKLLRVLQEREVSRVGGDRDIPVDVRVICTTNRKLELEVREGRFREDLYYRLNVIPAEIQPLRQRRQDVEALVGHFIEKYNSEYGYVVEGIAPAALEKLKDFDWPGNIRQLENVVERAMVFAKSGMLGEDRFRLGEGPGRLASAGGSEGAALRDGMTVAQAEQMLILQTLKEVENNRTRAAELLDISIRTLRNKLNEYAAAGIVVDE
jgi:DNA-binding NtrC family response regulator